MKTTFAGAAQRTDTAADSRDLTAAHAPGSPLDLYARMAKLRWFDRSTAVFRAAAATPSVAGVEALCAGVAAALAGDAPLVATYQTAAFLLAHGGDVREAAAACVARAVVAERGETWGADGDGEPPSADLAVTLAVGGGDVDCRQPVVCAVRGDVLDADAFAAALGSAIELRLPVVFVCENNALVAATLHNNLYEQARVLDVRTEEADGMNPRAVRSALRRLLVEATEQPGPCVLEALTFYPAAGATAWTLPVHYDPLARLRDEIVAAGLAQADELAALDAAVKEQVAQGIMAAMGEHAGPDAAALMQRARERVTLPIGGE